MYKEHSVSSFFRRVLQNCQDVDNITFILFPELNEETKIHRADGHTDNDDYPQTLPRLSNILPLKEIFFKWKWHYRISKTTSGIKYDTRKVHSGLLGIQ